MHLSVIISTYNSPEWLEKVLWGYGQQTHRHFEIVIAHDGSDERTRALIDRMRTELAIPITHVWQEDRGFRKCRILNKAVLQASHDYIVFTDGDCIPRSDFLAVHAGAAETGFYLSGSYFKLPMSTSNAITKDDIVSGRCFDMHWLRRHGLSRSRKNIKISAGPRSARWLNRLTTAKCNFKGSNASAWKEDILAVNGFADQMARDRSVDDNEHLRDHLGPCRQQVPKHERQRQRPLANRLLRQDIVHEQCRRFGHPSCTAARAEAAALARECHQLLGPTAVALDPKKTMLEQPTLEIRLELIFNVPRQRPPFGCSPIPEPGIVLGHEPVRNADDDVDVLATNYIEDDVATFSDSPIVRVNVVSFAACDRVLCF